MTKLRPIHDAVATQALAERVIARLAKGCKVTPRCVLTPVCSRMSPRTCNGRLLPACAHRFATGSASR